TVQDAALMLNAIAGQNSNDSTSVTGEVPDFTAGLRGDLRGLRAGIAREYSVDCMEAGEKAALDAAIKQLEALGAELVDVSLPHTEYALATYYITAPAEASANLSRFDGVKYGKRAEANSLLETYQETRGAGFGPEVKRRIML